jgi:tRNA modification GTPase
LPLSIPVLYVLNKADLLTQAEINAMRKQHYILCSTLQENGLDALKTALLAKIRISDSELSSGVLTNARQLAAVKKAAASIQKARESLTARLGFEFTAFDLKEASSALEEIVGTISTDTLLQEIFSNFCVGK